MDDEQIEELARQLAEDIESGKPIATEGTPTPDLTEEDVFNIRRAVDPDFYHLRLTALGILCRGTFLDSIHYTAPSA